MCREQGTCSNKRVATGRTALGTSRRLSDAAKRSSRPRPVTLNPGFRHVAVTAVPSSRSASSRENMTSSSLVMPYRRDDSRAVNGDVSVSQLLSHELPKTAGGPGDSDPGPCSGLPDRLEV